MKIVAIYLLAVLFALYFCSALSTKQTTYVPPFDESVLIAPPAADAVVPALQLTHADAQDTGF